MQQDIRWKQRFENYCKAVAYLSDEIDKSADTDLDVIKKGIVQSFEITHELAWKVMQDYLKAQGEVDVFGSKIATRLAFNRELINQGEIWLDMIETRNITVHTYDEKILNEQFQKVVNNYLPLFLQFQQRLEKLCQISD